MLSSDLAAEHLVAGLHVGEVQVGEHVRDSGQQPVADGVPEVEHAVRLAGQEARAEDDVGLAVEDRAEQLPYSAGSYSRSASCTIT